MNIGLSIGVSVSESVQLIRFVFFWRTRLFFLQRSCFYQFSVIFVEFCDVELERIAFLRFFFLCFGFRFSERLRFGYVFIRGIEEDSQIRFGIVVKGGQFLVQRRFSYIKDVLKVKEFVIEYCVVIIRNEVLIYDNVGEVG